MILKAKYIVGRLKDQVARLPADGSEPGNQWLEETQALLETVFQHRKDLASDHQALWQVRPTTDVTPVYKASLEKMIRSLNCTDEIKFSDSPVLVLTLAGILFLITMAGGTWLYYVLFLSR